VETVLPDRKLPPNQSSEPSELVFRNRKKAGSSASHAMKYLRVFLVSYLVVASASVFSGCASTSHDSYTALNDSSGLEKRQPSPTEDMNAMEKTGYYLGWYSLVALYVWAGGSAPILPP
jgi:hypothetical protein